MTLARATMPIIMTVSLPLQRRRAKVHPTVQGTGRGTMDRGTARVATGEATIVRRTTSGAPATTGTTTTAATRTAAQQTVGVKTVDRPPSRRRPE
jgi:hypothetical protein